jgi:proteasome lid subunit RPN8/RPN11
MIALRCPAAVIESTLSILKLAGQEHRECIVLWLGIRRGDVIEVGEAYRPDHFAREDMFSIPPKSMAELMSYLRDKRLMIAAQVHTHPGEAFHSAADDRLALVRHVGALSLVLPYFAEKTSAEAFVADTAFFELSANDRWLQVPASERALRCQIIR